MTSQRTSPRQRTNLGVVAGDKRLPYSKQPRLITPSELRFLHTGLQPAIGKRFYIAVQVPLTSVIRVADSLWDQPAGRKIRQKRIDFVLVYPKTFRIAAAIELDDLSHESQDRYGRDEFIDNALSSAGVLLIRIPVYRKYEPERIRGIINAALKHQREAAE